MEQATRDAVREKIDQKLYRDASRLAEESAGFGQLAAPAAGQVNRWIAAFLLGRDTLADRIAIKKRRL
jgi:hypothetical protein